MVLKANAGSTPARTVGVVMTVAGGVAILSGGVLLIQNNDSRSGNSDDGTIGAFTALVGGGILTAGILLVTANKTRIDFGPAPNATDAPRLRLTKSLELTARGLEF
jgi:hypothetical protein